MRSGSAPRSESRRRTAAELLDDAGRQAPRCFTPSARASAVICGPARGISASASCGRIAAFVSACADPQLAHERLADDVVQSEQRRVQRVGAQDRAERELGRVALGPVGIEGLGDQLRAAQRRHLGDGVRRAACRAQSAPWARAFIALARSRSSASPTISGGSARTTAGRISRLRLAPLRQAVDRGHLGARERRRQRRHADAADGRDRLRDIDHSPAAQRDQVAVADVIDQFRGDLVHRPGRDVVKAGRAPRRARPGHAPIARSVVSSSYASKPCAARMSGESLTIPSRK